MAPALQKGIRRGGLAAEPGYALPHPAAPLPQDQRAPPAAAAFLAPLLHGSNSNYPVH